MRKPASTTEIGFFKREVENLWGKVTVVTAAPALADLAVGEIAIGSATEAAPAAGSHALYFKESTARIVVISTDGATLATRFIT